MISRTDYLYDLPEGLIAKHPADPRESARLLIVDRASGTFTDARIGDLSSIFGPQDLLVFNDTKVMPSRLFGHLPTGGKCECLLLREKKPTVFEAIVKPARKLKKGTSIRFSGGLKAIIAEDYPQGRCDIEFFSERPIQEVLEEIGTMPLPPYIRGGKGEERDKKDYQTVYAKKPGAAAAPTAGLHFTEGLLDSLRKRGVDEAYLTLHVGLGTFMPVVANDIRDHRMHREWYEIPEQTAEKLKKNRRIVAVGTTSCRALESAARDPQFPCAMSGDTDLFIYPGYEFKQVDALLTNFHLPGSSLLMLVSAFAGFDLIRAAYEKAISDKYRFFSYGDAMLIL